MFTSNIDEEEIQKMYKIISCNVKKYRLKKKMSQLELALTIGQRGNAFFNYAENNTNNKHFNFEHLYKIAKALQISFTDLFEGIE
ncbi:helix-turn-helix transcriptional regulator [Candidatus Marinarcus aquaticus]|uniref:Transcriptional regulator n=1 Tax=Candidatus Marinarcus aquaticus TaxID=2044504 RepID=A0A4Q0XR21_9BACT|nr:transcriptional regulator [Candidatus Marinarcus aquaticus]